MWLYSGTWWRESDRSVIVTRRESMIANPVQSYRTFPFGPTDCTLSPPVSAASVKRNLEETPVAGVRYFLTFVAKKSLPSSPLPLASS
jgi:hypothetical protein